MPQYVVSRHAPDAPDAREVRGADAFVPGAPQCAPVAAVLADVKGVRVLDDADPAMVLVEMTDEARARVERAHPELVVEPNITYRRAPRDARRPR